MYHWMNNSISQCKRTWAPQLHVFYKMKKNELWKAVTQHYTFSLSAPCLFSEDQLVKGKSKFPHLCINDKKKIKGNYIVFLFEHKIKHFFCKFLTGLTWSMQLSLGNEVHIIDMAFVSYLLMKSERKNIKKGKKCVSAVWMV